MTRRAPRTRWVLGMEVHAGDVLDYGQASTPSVEILTEPSDYTSPSGRAGLLARARYLRGPRRGEEADLMLGHESGYRLLNPERETR